MQVAIYLDLYNAGYAMLLLTRLPFPESRLMVDGYMAKPLDLLRSQSLPAVDTR